MEYEQLREEALVKLQAFLDSKSGTIDDAMNKWADFVESSEFMKMAHKLDVYSVYEDDDDPLLKPIAFYGKNQIKEAWDGYEYQELLKENAFIIGYVDFGDDYIFASINPGEGIAIVNHEYVFCTEDLDQTVASVQSEINCSLEKLLTLLAPKE